MFYFALHTLTHHIASADIWTDTHPLHWSINMFRFLRSTIFNARTQFTSVLIVALLMVVYFTKDSADYKIILQHLKVNPFVRPKIASTTRAPYVYSWPKCQQNTSAANIKDFSSLPRHIQDFLYYRHCRHFPMLLDIPDKCGGPDGSSEIFLLLVIKSSPGNYDRREGLRKTWAQERLQYGKQIRRVFLSGTSGDGVEKMRLNKLLKLEQHENNDILQWDFNDSFYNLTLKQILFLEWMERNCPHVHFLMNGDDDVFAHTDNMVLYLNSLVDNIGDKHLFVGHIIAGVGPIRSPESKYYIPVQVQESESYPTYCGGGGFVLSGYTASVIYNMSHSITILPIDDVYMGMCMAKAGVGPASHWGVRLNGLHLLDKSVEYYDPCNFRDMLIVHRFLPMPLYLLWYSLHDPTLKCTKKTEE